MNEYMNNQIFSLTSCRPKLLDTINLDTEIENVDPVEKNDPEIVFVQNLSPMKEETAKENPSTSQLDWIDHKLMQKKRQNDQNITKTVATKKQKKIRFHFSHIKFGFNVNCNCVRTSRALGEIHD